ncbi:MAG TPA: fibronectin type III domain-containing protein [Patescibacteria group bacterium]|nr:fibronectin type III domain-containing protein [Patescibacteria group bacterium]
MSARQNKSSGKLLLLVALVVLVGGFFLLKSKSLNLSMAPSTKTNSEATATPTAAKKQMTTAEAKSAVSGPVGRNSLRAYPGPGVGQVTLEWQRYFPDGENFSVHYGTLSKGYTSVNPLIGYISTYTVNNLTPGTKYYFVIEGFKTGGVSAGWDGEVSAIAPSSPVAVVGIMGPVGRNQLTAKAGPKKGQVTLSWVRYYPDTEKYSVVYGLMPGKYAFGVLNAVNTMPQTSNYSYTVGSLNSGTRYYFALEPQRNGTAIYATSEVSVVAP